MADSNSNGGRAFWADASKRTATWSGVAAIAVVIEDWLDSAGGSNLGWEHLAMVGLAAAIRAVVALVQGKVGDPARASFSKAPADDDPAE